MNFSYRTTDAIIQSIIQFAHVSRLFFSVLAVNPSSDKIWHRVVQKKKWHKDTQNSIFFFFFFVFVRLISRLTKGKKTE